MSSIQVTTNFRDSNGADLGTKLVTKDYLISVYPEIGQQIGIPPELWTWGSGIYGRLGNGVTTGSISTPITTFAGGTNWKQVVAGSRGVIAAIKTDGTLWTWGNGSLGQVGNAVASGNTSTPVTTFAGGTDWKQVSAGFYTTSAIKTDGTLWGWGLAISGTLGNTTGSVTGGTAISTPITTFAGGTNWKQVSSGNSHTAAIKTDGTLWIWGFSVDGRLGENNQTNYKFTPVTTFAGGTNWADTATTEPEDLYTLNAGTRMSAAIKTDGTLWVWGNGRYGSLGNRSGPDAISTPITTFAGGTNWKQVSSGNSHTAAIKTDGTLWTWGSGSNGRLGNAVIDFNLRISTPITTFAGGTNWKQVSAGNGFSAAIKTDGTLWTWGSGSNGRLGNAVTTNVSTPVTTFAGGTNWKQVSGGSTHTAAIKTDGTLWTWGNGGQGRLGNATTSDNISTPITTFAGGTNWKQVSGGSTHTAAIKTDGTLWTWGLGSSGQLGNLVIAGNISTPVTTFAGGTNWKQVSVGNNHTLALRDTGGNKELFTWGNGSDGILGAAQIESIKSTPITTFAGGSSWKQVSAGNSHTAAIKTDGTLWTWGDGDNGRLGNANIINTMTPVTTFAGGNNWKQVSAGSNHTAAIKTDGTLWTWGNGGQGRLGNAVPTGTIISTPVTTFAGGNNWKQVSAGSNHTAAIKTDGTLWTWGLGSSGQLGNLVIAGTIISTPVTTFAGGTNWKQVSVASHTAAIRSVDF